MLALYHINSDLSRGRDSAGTFCRGAFRAPVPYITIRVFIFLRTAKGSPYSGVSPPPIHVAARDLAHSVQTAYSAFARRNIQVWLPENFVGAPFGRPCLSIMPPENFVGAHSVRPRNSNHAAKTFHPCDFKHISGGTICRGEHRSPAKYPIPLVSEKQKGRNTALLSRLFICDRRFRRGDLRRLRDRRRSCSVFGSWWCMCG